ncbi:MAG: response regulator transcription factor [Acidobacteriales bacterium]|nr:response regulator transcription factor [Terriglobales bacterium]
MVSTSTSFDEIVLQPSAADGARELIRIIVADTQSIFRAGLRKIFALEDDIRVVGQAETLQQTLSAAKKFSADILLLEATLTPNPAELVTDLLRQTPSLRIVVVTVESNQELTLDLFRRGVHGIVSREVEPELLVDCLRKVAKGEPWLESQGIQWVLEAYRTQSTRAATTRPKVQLTPKETLIVSCVTQGMKNKEIAIRVGTTEQVVKNYLRKVYDKLGVADRLELALYCLHNRVLDGAVLAEIKPSTGQQLPVPASVAAAELSSSNSNAAAASAGVQSQKLS